MKPTLTIFGIITTLLASDVTSHAETLKYSSGATLQVDLGCTKKNGRKDQLLWRTARIKMTRSGRVNLQHLHTTGFTRLDLQSGGNRTIFTDRLVSDQFSRVIISGSGLFEAARLSGSGDLEIINSRVAVKLGAGSLRALYAAKGTVTMKNTSLDLLQVGQQATATGLTADLAQVLAGGRLTAADTTIVNLVVSGAMTGSGLTTTSTTKVEATGTLTLPTSATLNDLTVNGKLVLKLSAPVKASKLTSATGQLSVVDDPTIAVGTTITLIENTGTTASPAFAGLAEGTLLTMGTEATSRKLKISYVGGPGTTPNDVVGTVEP